MHLVPIRTEADLDFSRADGSPDPTRLDDDAERIRAALRDAGRSEVASRLISAPATGSPVRGIDLVDQVLALVAGAVHLGRHGVVRDQLLGGGDEQLAEQLGVVLVGVQPRVPLRRAAGSPACGRAGLDIGSLAVVVMIEQLRSGSAAVPSSAAPLGPFHRSQMPANA